MPKKASKDAAPTEPVSNNKPAATIRLGNLKCVLWRNEGEKGPWYMADLTRSFKTESGFQESSKIPAEDLLRLAFLAQQAYAHLQELKSQDKAAAQNEFTHS